MKLIILDRDGVINHDADRANALRDAGVGLGIASGLLLAGGAALVILAPKDEARPAPAAGLSVTCGLTGGLGLKCAGSF